MGLGQLLRGRDFRRLFAVRLTSQAGDGVLQVALASYALFSPERQPTPGDVAAALAVVLLPFSLLGPFAGVLLDRWSRRQVLLAGNLLRLGLAAVLAAVVAGQAPDAVFYGLVLACLSVNRFLLAGLSAALPHTVQPADLLTANALTPTAGTAAFVAGLGAGALLRSLPAEDVGVLLAAGTAYGVAGLLALRMARGLLGPDLDQEPVPVHRALGSVVRGLRAGLGHLARRPAPAAALAVMGLQRYCFGIVTVATILVVRARHEDPDAAFADLTWVTLVGGAGFVAAAVLTPLAVRRWGRTRWVVGLLAVAASAPLAVTVSRDLAVLLVTAALLGLAAQGIKICVDTVVQLGIDDAFRGRVFSLYDVLFNVAFVAAAATAAVVLPPDGVAAPVLVGLAAVQLAGAAAYGGSSAARVGRGAAVTREPRIPRSGS